MPKTGQPRGYREFPRAVYGPDGDVLHIMSEQERPDGYRNSPKDFQSAAETAAAEAKRDVAAAEKEERDAIKAYLTTHSVEFPPNLGLVKLRDLKVQLDAHLAAQGDDGGK